MQTRDIEAALSERARLLAENKAMRAALVEDEAWKVAQLAAVIVAAGGIGSTPFGAVIKAREILDEARRQETLAERRRGIEAEREGEPPE